MKRIIVTLIFVLVAHIFAAAQDKLETINLQGKDYTVSKSLPKEIVGLYEYEEKGAPIVELKDDGTGRFQPHGMPAIPIKVWIDVDEKGEPRKQLGTEERYRYTLLIQYGKGGDGNYKADSYTLLDATVLKDKGIVVILGERIMKLKQ